jgi:hypothetical protein
VSYLLRVVLPDKPGILGAVATALGGAGADILGVDVVERTDGQAIDDLAVELPSGRPPDVLITADPQAGLARLAEEVPRLFRAGWAIIAVREDGRSYRLADSSAAPETRAGDLPWLPLPRAMVVDPSVHWVPEPWSALDTELAAAPFGSSEPPKALVVGRPGGPAFRPSELARLAHLAGIVATVLGS